MVSPLEKLERTHEILTLVSAGDVSSVYRVRHHVLSEPRRAEIGRPGQLSQERLRAAFMSEARARARLRHRHIALLHDFRVADDGTAIVVSEHAPGPTLRQIIDGDTAISEDLAAVLFEQTLSALGQFHRVGLLHGDVTPESVVVREEAGWPCVKLIALRIEPFVMHGGSPYSSPEALRGEARLEPRADLFSLGLVFCELLSGVLPRVDPDGTEEARQRLRREVVGALGDGGPRTDLRKAILSLLHVDPGTRPPSALAVRRTLHSRQAGSERAERWRRELRPLVALALAQETPWGEVDAARLAPWKSRPPDLEQAFRVAAAALELDPDSSIAQERLADVQARLDEHRATLAKEERWAAFERRVLSDLVTDVGAARENLAAAPEPFRRHPCFGALAKKVQLQEGILRQLLERARRELRSQQLEAARSSLDQILARSPFDEEALQLRQELHQRSEARSEIVASVTDAADRLRGPERARHLLERARAALQVSLLDEAVLILGHLDADDLSPELRKELEAIHEDYLRRVREDNRRDAASRAAGRIDELLAQQKIDEARQALRAARDELGDTPELEVAEEAIDCLAGQERRVAIEQIEIDVRAFLEDRDPEGARAALVEGIVAELLAEQAGNVDRVGIALLIYSDLDTFLAVHARDLFALLGAVAYRRDVLDPYDTVGALLHDEFADFLDVIELVHRAYEIVTVRAAQSAARQVDVRHADDIANLIQGDPERGETVLRDLDLYFVFEPTLDLGRCDTPNGLELGFEFAFGEAAHLDQLTAGQGQPYDRVQRRIETQNDGVLRFVGQEVGGPAFRAPPSTSGPCRCPSRTRV